MQDLLATHHHITGSQRQRSIMLIASVSCGKLTWPTTLCIPRPRTRQPAEQPTNQHLQTTTSTSHPRSQRCNSPCARAAHTQHTRPLGSSASPSVRLAASCDMAFLAGSYTERIAEWLRHVSQLFTAASPIAPEMLALLRPPSPHLPADPPAQKSRWTRLSQPSNASRTACPQGSVTFCQKR